MAGGARGRAGAPPVTSGVGTPPGIDVSVVIVNWNAGELLRRAVESLREAGETVTVEVIVVDNASTDSSCEFLADGPGACRVLHNGENLGFARASNQGIRLSRGRYVLLLNPDARPRPGAVEAMVAFMDAHPGAGASGPMLLNPDGSLQPSGGPLPTLARLLAIHPLIGRLSPNPATPPWARDFRQPEEVDEISGACLMVRRTAIEEVGLLDEQFFLYFEDLDWCLRLRRAGWKIYYVPGAQVRHVWRSRSDPSPRAHVHHLRSLRRYTRKHFGRGPAWLLTGLGIAVYACLAGTAIIRCLLDPAASHGRDLRRYAELLRVCLAG